MDEREELKEMVKLLATPKKIYCVRLPIWLIEEYKKRYGKYSTHVMRLALLEYLRSDVRIVKESNEKNSR
jgi:hypothetical protein